MEKCIRKLCMCGIVCLCCSVTIFGQNHNGTDENRMRKIEGVILDANTQEPLAGANVVDPKSRKG